MSKVAAAVAVAPGSAADAGVTPPWAEAVPSAAEAEAILLAVSVGNRVSHPARQAAAERALLGATELERAALSGSTPPVDVALLRSAAALRLRIDLALSALPSASVADRPAAEGLIGEVDGALSQLREVSSVAPTGVAKALEPIRRWLVEGGLRLTSGVSRLAPADAPEPALAPPPPPRRGPTRVLVDQAVMERPSRRARTALAVVFALSVLAAGAFHGQRVLFPGQPQRAPRPSGIPANAVGTRDGAQAVVMAEPGKSIDPEELERFRAGEEARGNVVREVAPGTFVSVPATQPSGGKP